MPDLQSAATIRILLIRHGETDWNRNGRFQGRSDIPLNETGKKQAQALAERLRDESLTAIYSSPLIRAMEMARAIQAFHPSVPIFSETGLTEMNLGEFEGMEGHDWAARYAEFRRSWRENPGSLTMPGGENLEGVQARALQALYRIAASYSKGSTLLFSSHNFVNLTLLCHAMGMTLHRLRELRQGPAAINIIQVEGGKLRVEKVNDLSHLEEKE